MTRDLASLLLRAAAYALPAVVLSGLGVAWLVEHRRWLPLGLATAAVTAALVLVSRWLAHTTRAAATEAPVAIWPDAGRAAWRDVDAIALRVAAAPPPFGDTAAYRDLFVEVLDAVGRHFHPGSPHPALELSVSQTLEIGERALRDLRGRLVDELPVVRSLRLADLRRMHRAMEHLPTVRRAGETLVFLNRVRRWLTSPLVAAAYEVVSALDLAPTQLVARQAARIGARFFVHRVGAYAIQAFSGQASLDLVEQRAAAEAAPVRILLLGPLNAGKSSLLNAIFGRERSKTDLLPCPGVREEHVLDREGLPQAVVFDSDGFGGAGDEAARTRLFAAVASADLILAVTSACQAARQLECETLAEVRRRFAASTRRGCPPIVVAATHIDQLRPAREWDPPYDFATGERPKERSVREALDAIRADFDVRRERVVPVCLRPGSAYNVEAGLMAAIDAALPDAERAKFLRVVAANRPA